MLLSASRLLRDEYLMDINPILCCLDPLESDVFYVLAQCNKNKIYYSPILPVLPFLTINLLVLLVFILVCHLSRFCIVSNIIEYLVCDFVKNSDFEYYFYQDFSQLVLTRDVYEKVKNVSDLTQIRKFPRLFCKPACNFKK